MRPAVRAVEFVIFLEFLAWCAEALVVSLPFSLRGCGMTTVDTGAKARFSRVV